MKKAALWKRHKQKPSVFFAQRFSSSKSSNKLKKIHPSAVSSYPWPSANCGRTLLSFCCRCHPARHQAMDHAQLVITIHHSISRRMNRWCERAGWASTRIPKGLDHGRSFMFFFFACLHKFKNHWILMVPLRFNGFLWHKKQRNSCWFHPKVTRNLRQISSDPWWSICTWPHQNSGFHWNSWCLELRWTEMSWDELRWAEIQIRPRDAKSRKNGSEHTHVERVQKCQDFMIHAERSCGTCFYMFLPSLNILSLPP